MIQKEELFSSSYLAHHGVKGMKWGVWNSETADRYNGSDDNSTLREKAARKNNAAYIFESLGKKEAKKLKLEQKTDAEINAIKQRVEAARGAAEANKRLKDSKKLSTFLEKNNRKLLGISAITALGTAAVRATDKITGNAVSRGVKRGFDQAFAVGKGLRESNTAVGSGLRKLKNITKKVHDATEPSNISKNVTKAANKTGKFISKNKKPIAIAGAALAGAALATTGAALAAKKIKQSKQNKQNKEK